MRKATFLAALAFASTLALGSCGGSAADTACGDGIDNDNDGKIDDADPGCAFSGGSSESPDPSACNDGIDNDNDGLIDGDDWGCQIVGSTTEVEPLVDCNDGLDNDGDTLADYPQDPGCESPIDTTEDNPPACSDGADNDDDSLTDYPNDPGCTDADDTDEADPDPLPACADGVDNDGDGSMDYPQDPGCTAASDSSELDDCVAGAPVTGHPGGQVSGNTSNAASRLAAPDGCATSGSTAIAGEMVYGYVLDREDLVALDFDTEGSALDTVLYVRVNDCGTTGDAAACDDDSLGTTSRVSITDPVAGVYYAIVNGKSNFGGAFKLRIVGRIGSGGACTAGDDTMVCDTGLTCTGGTCQ